MPVQHGPRNSPLDFYWSLPVVTRSLVTAFVVTKVAETLGILPLQLLYLSWPLIVRKLQVWRLITPFLVLPGGFQFLILLIWTVQYGKILENTAFANRTADFLWMTIVGAATMLVLTFVPYLGSYFLGSALVEMLLYLWSRNYPTAQVSLWGLVNLQAFYLPFAYVALSLVLGGDWRPSVIGILSGHLYYYLTTIYPATGGRRLLETPTWLKRALIRGGLGNVDRREVPMANPAAPGFRPFTGAGRRLA